MSGSASGCHRNLRKKNAEKSQENISQAHEMLQDRNKAVTAFKITVTSVKEL